jgi:hypothetical protein
MFKKGRQRDAIIGGIRLFSNDQNIVLAAFGIQLDNLLTATSVNQFLEGS